MSKTFGKRPDGTIEICRAKPENRGRGTCTHGDHLELTDEQLSDSFLQKFNEKVLEEQFEKMGTLRANLSNTDDAKRRKPFEGNALKPFGENLVGETTELQSLQEKLELLKKQLSRQVPGSKRSANTQRRINALKKKVENEKAYEKLNGARPQQKGRRAPIPRNTPNHIQPTPESEPMSRAELVAASAEIASQISRTDWQFLKDFQEGWKKKANEAERRRLGDISKTFENYLENDESESAQKMREFLGDEIDYKDFSEIVTGQVRAMTARDKWNYRARSVSRMVLTAVDNDMNNQRYIASVAFFGGRCCYCNVPLQKRPPPERQASGEHLTPISGGEILGGTRFGNMALACIRCNGARGNKELVEFVRTSPTIEDSQRGAVLGRIEAFRNFALYEEHSKEKTDKIRRTVERLNSEINQARRKNPDGELTREQSSFYKNKVNAAIAALQGGE